MLDFGGAVGRDAGELVNVGGLDAGILPEDRQCKGQGGEESRGASTQQVLAYAAGGAGMVAAGLGIGFGLSASGKHGDLEAACPSYPGGCAPARRAEIDDLYSGAQRDATISTIAFVSAAVLLGGAVVLYVTSPTQTGPKRATAPTPFGRWTF